MHAQPEENARPAGAGIRDTRARNVVMRERQRAAAPARLDDDRDARGGVCVHVRREREREPSRRRDIEIAAGMSDQFTVLPLGQAECAADAGVDFGAGHRASGRGEQPLPRERWIEPGLEHPRRRGSEMTRNAQRRSPRTPPRLDGAVRGSFE